MGASLWMYFVPYQEDVQAALNALREDVFRRGDYFRLDYDLNAEPPTADQLRGRFGDDAEMHAEAMREEHEWRKGLDPTADIDTLLDWNADAGTHSILDISEVSETPEHSTVYPLPAQQMRDVFGTDQPTRADIQANETSLDGLIVARWTGFYFPVYQDGQPQEWCFFGVSGD
jgi:hypothetical protein